MNNPIWQLQKSIYNVLNSNILLAESGTKTYTHVPKKATTPYITIGEIQSMRNTLSNKQEIEFTIQIFSKSHSNKETLDIIDIITRNLNTDSLIKHAVNINILSSINTKISVIKQNEYWHGECNYMILIT